MKKLKMNTIWLLLGLLSTVACNNGSDEPTPLTDIEKIAQEWQVDKVFINGQEDTSGAFSTFQIIFQQLDGAATTYSVVPGNATDLPNRTANNQGSWTLAAGATQIILDAGTDQEVVLTIEAEISEDGLIISWQVPESIDKTQPTYRLELIPS